MGTRKIENMFQKCFYNNILQHYDITYNTCEPINYGIF